MTRFEDGWDVSGPVRAEVFVLWRNAAHDMASVLVQRADEVVREELDQQWATILTGYRPEPFRNLG